MDASIGTLLSVIVPVYNTPRSMFDRAMKSILSQSLQSFEIILIDDGSAKECGERCDSYAHSDSRIRVIHQENRGVSAARNAGIEAACSPWVMFVDPDDELLPGVLADAVRIATNYELDILYATVVDDRGGHRHRRRMGFDQESCLKIVEGESGLRALAEYFVSYEVPHGSDIPKALSTGPVARLFSRKTISGTRFKDSLTILEDTVFNAEAVLKAQRIGLLDRGWYIYYANVGSATNSATFNEVAGAQASTVQAVVNNLGLPINAYYSWLCTCFFMVVSSLSVKGELSYHALKRAYGLPHYASAFSLLDTNQFDYSSLFTRLKYDLTCSGRLRSLLLLYRARNAVNAFRWRSAR